MVLPKVVHEHALRYPRIAGLVITLIGCVLLYTGFISAVIDISRHVPEVEFSEPGFVIGVVTVMLGLFLIITGPRYIGLALGETHDIRQKVGTGNYIAFMAVIIIGGFIAYYMDQYLAAHGYSHK